MLRPPSKSLLWEGCTSVAEPAESIFRVVSAIQKGIEQFIATCSPFPLGKKKKHDKIDRDKTYHLPLSFGLVTLSPDISYFTLLFIITMT
jgi:hypothetical protein